MLQPGRAPDARGVSGFCQGLFARASVGRNAVGAGHACRWRARREVWS